MTWAPLAIDDLREAWTHYARVASPDIADRVVRDIGRSVSSLVDRSAPGRPRDELLAGLRSIRSPPYSIFFRLRSGDVQIVRIMHERRDLTAAFVDLS